MSKKKRHFQTQSAPERPEKSRYDFSSHRTAWMVSGAAILFLGLFYYYWRIIHPEYIHLSRQPVFFASREFLRSHLQMPGGFLDFMAAFLTDLFQTGWLGAAMLAALALIVVLLLYKVLRFGSFWIVPLLPALFLIMAQARYDYPVVKTLSLILALEGFILCRDAAPSRTGIRLAVILPSMALIYVLSPGAAILYALLCILHEMLGSGVQFAPRLGFSITIIFWSVFIPWIAARILFLVPAGDAFLRHSPLWQTDASGATAVSKIPMDGIAVLLILLLAAISFLMKDNPKNIKNRYHVLQAAFAALLIAAGARTAVDRTGREFLAVRHAAHHGNWDLVNTQIHPRIAGHPLGLFHFNRALYHRGRLATDFFSIRQNFGGQGLFLDRDARFQYPLDYSDFFYEIGHVNEAKRWAFEALTLYGESSEVLKRLALVHILQDETEAASRFLNRLRQNPVCRDWAGHYLACLSDKTKLRGEKDLQKIHALMPADNFLVTSAYPEIDMEKLAAQSSVNRQALDYALMTSLINRDLDVFSENLIRFQARIKMPLPELYEEALIACQAFAKKTDPRISSIPVRKSTLARFEDFERILKKHGGKSEAAYSELAARQFKTYWFYLLYTKRAG
ncbi:hypothetical protein JW906_06560 [bacterium]|nr:hypothetical protein [bacterium]